MGSGPSFLAAAPTLAEAITFCLLPLQDFFLFRSHLCLAFELLSLNLYELIRHNKFRGLSLPLVRVFTTQVRAGQAGTWPRVGIMGLAHTEHVSCSAQGNAGGVLG